MPAAPWTRPTGKDKARSPRSALLSRPAVRRARMVCSSISEMVPFDNIAHGPLLAKLPTFTRTIEGWLKAGSIELGDWRESGAGTPQGGIASPLLANIALDGLERLFEATTKTGKPI